MPRTINFTGRKKIRQDDIHIQLQNKEKQLCFQAKLQLSGYSFPDDAEIYIEAYRGLSALWKRFHFGRASLCEPPKDCSLNEFEYPEGIRFRLKITSIGDHAGRLLGHADSIRPLLPDESERPPLPMIDVDKGPLGGNPWKICFHDNDAELPTLVMNERIEDWNNRARDPLFQSLVMPCIMREILTRILIVDKTVGDEDDPENWRLRWLDYAETLPAVTQAPDPLENTDDEDRHQEITDWIDDAVNSFGKKSGLTDSLINRWNTEETQ